MAEGFKPIETQEEFDAAIKDRLERAKNAVRKEYEGFEDYKTKAEAYDSKVNEYEARIADMNKSLTEKDGKIKTYETNAMKAKIAQEFGIPSGMASRLSGDNENDIRKDAESMKSYFGKPQSQAPSKGHTPQVDPDAKYKSLLKSIRKD